MDISMDIHAKSVDMDMDMDGKFHIHGKPGCVRSFSSSLPLLPPSPFPPLPSLFPFPLLPLEVGPLNTARGLGEHCKLPQRSLGRSPSQNRFGAC